MTPQQAKLKYAHALGKFRDVRFRRQLLDGTANVREYIIGVRADEANRAHHDYEDNRQHHCVFGDILTALIAPKFL